MKQINPTIANTVNYIFLITFAVVFLYVARFVLIPLTFSIFFALLFYPLNNFFERIMPRMLAILLIYLLLLIVIAGIFYFFGSQFYHLFQHIKNVGQSFSKIWEEAVNFIDTKVFRGNISIQKLFEQNFGAGGFIAKTISSSTNFIIGLMQTIVYNFLFLLYRTSFKNFITSRFSESKKEYVTDILYNIQKVAQNYFLGISLNVVILGTMNGLGLWLIGISYPFLFGYFAAILAIIPYIGTFIGGFIPSIYALINNGLLTAVFVVLWYTGVQMFEGNILTPNVVGSRVRINPLFALISLIIGDILWGIAGMVLFIPIMAILKVIFESIEPLKPYGLLLSSNFGNPKKGPFRKKKKKG